MATLILASAGAALGQAFLPGGVSLLGATLSGATIGGLVGSLAGSQIDAALFRQKTHVTGPRLGDLQPTASVEGAPVPRLYGRARMAGQVIWAARFKELAATSTSGGGKTGAAISSTSYQYFASFAVGLCEGPITRIGRIWADGRPLNQDGLNIRVHLGTETQTADVKIEAVEGAGNAPAYRGLAYVVFEDLPLEDFGNRIPQLSFEVHRRTGTNLVEDRIKGVNLIPASGEFAYATETVLRLTDQAVSVAENLNNAQGEPDAVVALEQLDAELTNLETVQLVVAWFGNDLRCGTCLVRPGVDSATKVTSPVTWSAGGATRAGAHLISSDANGPFYGGTPSDLSVVQTIQWLKARGHKVVIYPFILMDVPPGNVLPDPYVPGGFQPAFPWRGRITCHPAPSVAGTADKTAAAAAQVASFFGTAAPPHFAVNGTSVIYSGPDEWSLRRFILHLAALAKAAGGVDGFIIGSELKALTTVRSSASDYPAVTQLKTLAADVRMLLGPGTKLTYAADWSEYFGHQPTDGSGDVHFHLDPLWSDSNIDAIGIDYYVPLSDWRDGTTHLDAQAGTKSPTDLTYLKSNVLGGEGYSWYYTNQAARDAQTRTNITDGTYGEPWVFRYKDLKNWWLSAHHNRPGGVRSGTPTAWIPQSKPIWLTEYGCPAADKGANQPNVFFDPKSSESTLPYYSNGQRDDLIQRKAVEAIIEFWDPANGQNPTSAVYAAPMIDMARSCVWTWDARPYPDFPSRTHVWRDAGNWELGHWINGRTGLVPVADIIKELCIRAGVTEIDTSAVQALAAGYLIPELISTRAALEPLLAAFHIDAAETGGLIRFTPRGASPAASLVADDLATENDRPAAPFQLTRAQTAGLPAAIKASFHDPLADYRSGTVEARRETAPEARIARLDWPLTLEAATAQGIAERILGEAWTARERLKAALPPSRIALEPGDIIALTVDGGPRDFRLQRMTGAAAREFEAEAAEASLYEAQGAPGRVITAPPVAVPGPVLVTFADLPLMTGFEIDHAPHVAAFAQPWPAGVAIYRAQGVSYVLNQTLTAAAVLGESTSIFQAGPEWRWDEGNTLTVRLYGGTLAARTADDVLAGANLAALRNPDGEWELFQFRNAVLVSGQTFALSGLLRARFGTEGAMRSPLAPGARFVLIDPSLKQMPVLLSERALSLTWKAGPASLPPSDARYISQTHTHKGMGLRPYSPVRVTAKRDSATQDISIAWIRRTRISGDAWEPAEIPLGETSQSYAVDIFSGASVVRTLTGASPAMTYTAAQQTSDFGGASFPTLTLAVFQLGEIFGRGRERKVTLNV